MPYVNGQIVTNDGRVVGGNNNYDLPGDQHPTSGGGVWGDDAWGSWQSGTPTGNTGTPQNPALDAAQFVAQVTGMFPWITTIGLDPAWFHEVAASSSGADEVMLKLRQSPQFKARFPGMYRADGTVRMTEAQYMARESDYRGLLRQYGYDMSQYESPDSLVGFFENEMAPDEVGQRLEVYRNVSESSQSQRDSFYVYAGLQVSVDDLYEATVDPAAAQNLRNEYNSRVASGSFDYTTWIQRATEVGLQRVAETLGVLQERGEVTSRAVQSVLSVNPGFAQQIMDGIYTGGDGTSTSTLSLDELLSSFEFAAVGAAAKEAGLELPTRERLAEIRSAGVQRQQQIDGYRNYGQEKAKYNAASLRSGGDGFTQEEFEAAAFFGNTTASNELEDAMAQEAAAGADAGDFRFAEDRGRLVQRGLGR